MGTQLVMAGSHIDRHEANVANARTAAPISSGVPRLDVLLGGGFQPGSSILIHGPPFTGKSLFQRAFFLESLRARAASLYILTDQRAAAVSTLLGEMDATAPTLERVAPAIYVDCYTRYVGGEVQHPQAIALDGLADLAAIERATIDALPQAATPAPRVVLQSISTLMLEAGPTATLRFLRHLLGRLRLAGCTTLFGLESGMHPPTEVQALKHLCDGLLETREDDERFFLRVDGLPVAFRPGWIEYEYSPTHVDLTGSFAPERIRGSPAAR